jgi:hypothetical protein
MHTSGCVNNFQLTIENSDAKGVCVVRNQPSLSYASTLHRRDPRRLTVSKGTHTGNGANENDGVSRNIIQPDGLVVNLVNNLLRVQALSNNSTVLCKRKVGQEAMTEEDECVREKKGGP